MTETIDVFHSFDARHARNIGEQSVSSNIQAINELIKNCYDADATKCKVHLIAKSQFENYVELEKIVVEDNGIGMLVEDVKHKWLRVATSTKEENPLSEILKRRVAGEKGMGRFASQKLGNMVKIISNPEDFTGRKKSKYSNRTWTLQQNWNNYTSGKDFEKIPNKLKVLDSDVEDHGFRIEITELKGNWTLDDVDNVMINAGTLVSPKVLKKAEEKSFDVEVVCHNFLPKRKEASLLVLIDWLHQL